MRVLIADDDPVSRSLLEAYLHKWGYEVLTVQTGTEALEVLRALDPPKLAILDWMMPGMDGVEVCRELRRDEEGSYTYVVLLTGKGRKEDLVQGIDAGADDYIVKPFDNSELRARIGAGKRVVHLHQELIRARDALRYQATHDPLTGLWNRTAIFELLERDLSRTVREGHPLSLAIVDIDHFKAINDNHGHSTGDAVLVESAWRMRRALRGYDAIGRLGGEEFLILFPGCAQSDAVTLTERLRSALGDTAFVFGRMNIPLTVSIGLAPSELIHPLDMTTMMRAGDSALYRAKRLGRNRVEVASSSDLPQDQVSLEPA